MLLPFAHITIQKAASKSSDKVKYTCPECEQKVWGKPFSNVLCGDCLDDNGEYSKMLSADEEAPEKPRERFLAGDLGGEDEENDKPF